MAKKRCTNWGSKERKAHITKHIIYHAEMGQIRSPLIFPGFEGRDLEFGIMRGSFIPGYTKPFMVEHDPEIVDVVEGHAKRLGFDYELWYGAITDLDLRTHGPDRSYFDLVYLDLCNLYTQEIHDWIKNHLRGYILNGSDFFITVTNRIVPNSMYWDHPDRKKMSLTAFLKKMIGSALGKDFTHVCSVEYNDTSSMIVLHFKRMKGLDMPRNTISNMTPKQQRVYDNLSSAGLKAAYTKALRNANTTGKRSAVTKQYASK